MRAYQAEYRGEQRGDAERMSNDKAAYGRGMPDSTTVAPRELDLR